jgi:hypothetical protein
VTAYLERQSEASRHSRIDLPEEHSREHATNILVALV